MRIVLTCLLLLLLLTLPALPAAAQERCVQNPVPARPDPGPELYFLRGYPAGALAPSERARLDELEKSKADWAANVGLGNGWVADGPNTCVLHYDASGAPVLGTRIYLLGSTSQAVARTVPSGEGQSAKVIAGPANIRSGPGLQHARVRLCGYNWPLTVWTPAQGGWLRASCYGARGWIHQSLVSIAGAAPVAVRLPAAPATEAAPAAVSPQAAAVGALSLPADAMAQQAMVIRGPAHIRSGPGRQHASVAWCGVNWSLTVWTPAQGGWLPASCHGANGWIHESLISIGG